MTLKLFDINVSDDFVLNYKWDIREKNISKGWNNIGVSQRVGTFNWNGTLRSIMRRSNKNKYYCMRQLFFLAITVKSERECLFVTIPYTCYIFSLPTNSSIPFSLFLMLKFSVKYSPLNERTPALLLLRHHFNNYKYIY